MSQAFAAPQRMSVAEFVEMIRPYPDEERWELLDGEAILMSPPTERHQIVVANLLGQLHDLARTRGCRALPGLGLLNDAIDDYAPIPDIVVRCGPLIDGGYATDPILIAEVLSRSTAMNDRGRKLAFYQTIPSLRTILIAFQSEMRIEAWQRKNEGWTDLVLKADDAILPLPELGGELRLAEVYQGVTPLD